MDDFTKKTPQDHPKEDDSSSESESSTVDEHSDEIHRQINKLIDDWANALRSKKDAI